MKYSQRVGPTILLVGAMTGIAIYAITWTERRTPALVAPTPEKTAALYTPSNADYARDASSENGRIAPEADGQGTHAPPAESQGVDPDALYGRLVNRLEESVAGALSTADLLDAALEVAGLQLEKLPATEVDPAGRIAYPYLGTPNGLSASLRIQRSVRTGMLGLSLTMDLARPTTPYWVDGYARGEPTTEFLVRIDPDGRPTSFAILTETQVSGVNAKYGIDCFTGRIPTGMSYEIDLNAPFEWKANTVGMIDGAPTSWKPSVFLGGTPSDDVKKIYELIGLLEASYQGLKQ